MKLTRFWFLLAVLTLTAASLGFGVAGAPQPQSNFWSITGNERTDPSINFLGTTNNQGLAFRTNNLERVRVTEDGRVGIGTSIPQERFHVAGNLRLEGDLKCATPCVDGSEIVDGSISVADVNTEQVQARVGGFCAPGSSIRAINADGTVSCEADDVAVITSLPWSAITEKPAGFADGVDNDVLGALSCAAGQIAKWNGSAWVCSDDDDTTYTAGTGIILNGTALSIDPSQVQMRVNIACSPGSAIRVINSDGTVVCEGAGGGWSLVGNAGTNPSTNFLGTTDIQPMDIRVNNTRALRLEPTSGTPNIIGGFAGNAVTSSAVGGTVSGGGTLSATNRVTDDYSTVSGGRNNQAGNATFISNDTPYATVSGGLSNTASGGSSTVGGGQGNMASNTSATVAGGQSNTASGFQSSIGGGFQNQASDTATTVGGGQFNSATSTWATVSGGASNTAAGFGSTVPGGQNNTAQGATSFAAGRRAKALNTGAFVWADSTDADFASTAANQFNVRASGGVRIFTDSTATVGVELAAGASSWGVLSDRNFKENFQALNPQEILERLVLLPITAWNLKSQEESIRHIGPTAQDFYAAFGLGESQRYINTSDAQGVAMAAIQGLYQMVRERDLQLASQQQEINTLQQKQVSLEARLAALERSLGDKSGASQQSGWGRFGGWHLAAGMVLLGLLVAWRSRPHIRL